MTDCYFQLWSLLSDFSAQVCLTQIWIFLGWTLNRHDSTCINLDCKKALHFGGRVLRTGDFSPILPIKKPGPRLSKTDSVVGPLWGIKKIKTRKKIVWIYHLLKWTNEKTAKPFWSFVDCWCVISHADEPVDNRASTPPASAVERR